MNAEDVLVDDSSDKDRLTATANSGHRSVTEKQQGMLMDTDDRRILFHGALFGVDLSELYRPKRIPLTCRRFCLTPGCALDLQNGLDFTKASRRAAEINNIKEEAPLLIIGGPPCTMRSSLHGDQHCEAPD